MGYWFKPVDKYLVKCLVNAALLFVGKLLAKVDGMMAVRRYGNANLNLDQYQRHGPTQFLFSLSLYYFGP